MTKLGTAGQITGGATGSTFLDEEGDGSVLDKLNQVLYRLKVAGAVISKCGAVHALSLQWATECIGSIFPLPGCPECQADHVHACQACPHVYEAR